eukprot:SM000013S26527  [mRNA]  locus=s13:819546:821910:- [translate_table: standard]
MSRLAPARGPAFADCISSSFSLSKQRGRLFRLSPVHRAEGPNDPAISAQVICSYQIDQRVEQNRLSSLDSRREAHTLGMILVMRRSGIIACLRADSLEVARRAAEAALQGGIEMLEVTMTTPKAPAVSPCTENLSKAWKLIRTLKDGHPQACIGAGTVLTRHEADLAVAAGAEFLLSPVYNEALFKHCSRLPRPVLFIPGAMTPTEIVQAHFGGANLIKIFPIEAAGGTDLLQAMARIVKDASFVPAHGIQLDMVAPYIAAGALAVVLSSAIFDKRAMKARDYETIKQKAAAAAHVGTTAAAAVCQVT